MTGPLGGVNRPSNQFNFNLPSTAKDAQKSAQLAPNLQTFLEEKGVEIAQKEPTKNQEAVAKTLQNENVKEMLLGGINDYTKGAQLDETRFLGSGIALAILSQANPQKHQE